MKRIGWAILCLAVWAAAGTTAFASGLGPAVSAETAEQRLLEGNRRYVDARMAHPDQTARRRDEIARAQHPFAAIVSCSDSRVPPEVIFDQGLGNLFIIRLAGNIVDAAALGSIEYAVEHLGVRYVMVLGHERCGAVEATVKGGSAPGQIGILVKAIQPAVDEVRSRPGDLLDHAVRANVDRVVERLRSSAPILNEAVKKGVLTVKGAYYDLDDGTVSILPR
ncbi:MAG: carbonic anhydrase [Syntrophales bacterium]